MLVLLVLPVAQPAAVTCAPEHTTVLASYLYKCTDGTEYDLTHTHSSAASAGYLKATDKDEHDYYFGIASAVTSVTCPDGISGPVAIQTWGDPQPPTFPSYMCAVTGTLTSERCTVGTTPAGSSTPPPLSCLYTGGETGRKTTINYACSTNDIQPIATQVGSDGYNLTVSGPTLCRQVSGRPEGWQWGDTFVLLFLLFGASYVFGGGYYNVRYHEKQPWTKEAIPHWEHWVELPALVQDGLQFTREKGLQAWEVVREQLRLGGFVGDAEQSEGLAAAEESSSYHVAKVRGDYP